MNPDNPNFRTAEDWEKRCEMYAQHIQDLKKQLSERDAEIDRLSNRLSDFAFEHPCYKLSKELEKENGKMKEQLQAAVEIMKVVVEINDEECYHDHHGYCQAHNLEEDCHIERARQFLKEMEGKS